MSDKGSVDYHKRIDFRALDVFVDAVSGATKDELKQAVKTASEKSKDYSTYAYDRLIWKRLASLLRAELKGYKKNPRQKNPSTKNPKRRYFLYDVLNDYSTSKVDGKSDFGTLAHAKQRGVKDNGGAKVIWRDADMPPRTHKQWFGYNKHKELIYLISTHGLISNPIPKKKSRKKNPEIEIRELILWAENSEPLSNQFYSIIKNLERKAKKGIYQPALAAKLWKYWIDNAVKDYNAEVLGGGRSLKQNVFTVQDRKDAAMEVEAQWRDDIFRGDNPKACVYEGKRKPKISSRDGYAVALISTGEFFWRGRGGYAAPPEPYTSYEKANAAVKRIAKDHGNLYALDDFEIHSVPLSVFKDTKIWTRRKNPKDKNPHDGKGAHILFVFSKTGPIKFVAKHGKNWQLLEQKTRAHNFKTITAASNFSETAQLKKGQQIGIMKASLPKSFAGNIVRLSRKQIWGKV